jgi:ubiquinone/menaquinone biosynthesis C-methylase UbiE
MNEQRSSFVANILMHTFGQPRGLLGNLGGRLMARLNRPMNRWVIQLLDVQPHEKVLEIGFGPGVGIELLAAIVTTGVVAGVDASETMVKQARRRNAAAIEAGLVDLQQGSVEQLPYADDTFDKALTVNSLHIWPDVIGGLREIRRVLKRGGKLAVCFTNPAFQPTAWLEWLTSAGFTDVQMHERHSGVCAIAVKS